MKVLAISFSPRSKGNTMAILEEALNGARDEKADVELYSISGKNIQPCDGCRSCANTGKCHITDDMQELYDKIVKADGIIFGTPIYFWGMTGQAKTVMDRTIALNQPGRNLTNKVAGVVAVCGSLGLVDALKDYSYFIIQRRMLPANHVAAYVSSPEELKNMEQCLNAAHRMGQQIVALINMNFKYPEEFIERRHGAYGTNRK
ncbi:flavodoxin family protein [Chloroflexota bacterium]